MDDQACFLETFSSNFSSNDDLYEDDTEAHNISDLQAYYMAQFNMELESATQAKKKIEENHCFNYGENNQMQLDTFPTKWMQDLNNREFTKVSDNNTFQINNIDQNAIRTKARDVDDDLNDNFGASSESEITSEKNNFIANEKLDFEENCIEDDNSDYIDDEQLIMEELCKVDDNVTCRLSPDMFTDEFLSAITKGPNLLPPMEKAFSKHYCNYSNRDASIPENGSNVCNNLDLGVQHSETDLTINNLDNYSYPNNILNSLASDNTYTLPDTPTSSTEFSYDDSIDKRKVSICESIESDLQSLDYFDEGTGNIVEDEIFMNLDDLGLQFENDDDSIESETNTNRRFKTDQNNEKEHYYGERICLWESCYEKYQSQATLVEHIERTHVNTYKGEEFCCMWSECARSRRPFNARYKLLIHMRVHSGHKPNRCNHPGCLKAFSRLENLKIHMRSHTGERPYACPAPHCLKAFSNSSDRAKHQRTHFNARPYACGAVGCGKRYTDPSSLRKHVKTHPHTHAFTHTHVYTPPPPRVDKMAAKMASKMVDCRAGAVSRSPVKLHTIRSIRNKLAPELLMRSKQMF